MRLKQSISTGPSGLMLFIKLPLKIYNRDIVFIITVCCRYVCLLALLVRFCTDTSNFLLAEQIALHLIWTLLLPVQKKEKKSIHAGGMCRWAMRNAWEQKPAASFSSVFLRLAGLDCTSCSRKPPLWESLSSANERQIPRRAVEIAWKRLKRDPHSVVSLAFHCSWQTQEGTLLMKTLKKNWMLMKTNNFIPRCSWHSLWQDGRRKMLLNSPLI